MHRHRLDFDLHPDRGELLLGELRDRERELEVGRVEDGPGAAQVAAGQLSRSLEIRPVERIDVTVSEARHERGCTDRSSRPPSGPPPIACSAWRSRAKFTALRRLGLLRNSGREELSANILRARPRWRKKRERLMYFASSRAWS